MDGLERFAFKKRFHSPAALAAFGAFAAPEPLGMIILICAAVWWWRGRQAAKRRWLMSVANVEVGKSVRNSPTRRVSIRRDGEDFVIVSLAEDLVVFRNDDVSALRKICRSLHWEIAIDSCPVLDDRQPGNPKLDPIDQDGIAGRRLRTFHTL
jgi:hypothetical protein